MPLPNFDPTLAALHGLPSVAAVCGAIVLAGMVFLFSERRWRERWRRVPVDRRNMTHGPYRSARVVTRHFAKAPTLIRFTAMSSLTFGQVFLPALLLALTVMPFDGIAIALLPGILVTVAMWSCGVLLLRRSPSVIRSARSTALASLLANFGLFILCAVHATYVEYDPNYGIRQASNSVPAVAFLFAIVSTVQAVLLLITLHTHRTALELAAEA
jgi:hypothetical protein